MGMAFWALWKVPPVSASAAEETTLRRPWHLTRMQPLGIGVPWA